MLFSRRALWIIGLLYAVLIAGVSWGMFYVRDRAASELTTAEARKDWGAWKQETAEQAAGKGPVARREASTAEPPLAILMRDHFAVCFVGAVLFSSLLFAVLSIVTLGAWSGGVNPAPQRQQRRE